MGIFYPRRKFATFKKSWKKFENLLVAKETMEFDDEFIFFFGEVATLEIRSEVIDPTETAAFATTEESGGFG